MIQGCKEKFFINQIFDENIRRLHQGKKFFGKKMHFFFVFLQKNFFPWWRRLIFSSKIWLIKNFSLQPCIIWLINIIPRILIFTIKKRIMHRSIDKFLKKSRISDVTTFDFRSFSKIEQPFSLRLEVLHLIWPQNFHIQVVHPPWTSVVHHVFVNHFSTYLIIIKNNIIINKK